MLARKAPMMMTTVERWSVIVPANLVPGPQQGYWTYQDYAALPDDGRRYEIMDGVLLMAPSPGPAHQSVSKHLVYHLYQCIDLAGLGQVFYAPLDVELAPDRVFQPDVFVLLNASVQKLTTSRLVGAPDIVVEIASPGTAAYDRLSKSVAYAQAGVKEYWLVYPETRSIEVLALQSDTYRSLGIFKGKDTLPSQVVPNINVVPVEKFFVGM